MFDAVRPMTVLATALLWATPASACPLCRSTTGEQVRAAIFGPDFTYHLAVTLLPFPVFLGVVALIHFGPPRVLCRPPGGSPDRTAATGPRPTTTGGRS